MDVSVGEGGLFIYAGIDKERTAGAASSVGIRMGARVGGSTPVSCSCYLMSLELSRFVTGLVLAIV